MPFTPIRVDDERCIPWSAEQIWAVLADVAESPRWWPSAVRLTVLHVTPELVGSEMEVRPRGGQPFRCRIHGLEMPRRMLMVYPGQLIVGTGEWRLEPLGERHTRVTYSIDVQACGWLARIASMFVSLPRVHSNAMQKILESLEHETARRFC